MQIKSELITRLLLSLFLIFVVGKVISVVLKGFLDGFFNKKTKNSGGYSQLDNLIESKKSQFSSGQKIKSGSKSTGQKRKSRTEEAYLTSKDPDHKEVLDLLEQLQWGEGEAFAKIRSKLSRKFDMRVDVTEVVACFRQLVNHDILLSLEKKDLPSLEQILNAIQLKLYLDGLVEEICNGSHDSIQTLAKRSKVSSLSMAKSIEKVLLSRSHAEKNLIENLIKGSSILEKTSQGKRNSIVLESLISEDGTRFLSTDIYDKRFKDSSNLFDSLSPLPNIKNENDVSTALKIFNLSEETDQGAIKKRYKELASQKHPDKIEGQGIPKKYMDLANNNFTKIQEAYDILKKKIS